MLNHNYKEAFFIVILCLVLNLFDYVAPRFKVDVYKPNDREHDFLDNITVDRYYEKRKDWLTSNLGTMLFKNQVVKYYEKDRIFSVFVWKNPYWKETYIRNPLTTCTVKNCIFTSNDSYVETVDVILIHLFKNMFPWDLKRNPSQLWVFQSHESPVHNFRGTKNITRNVEAIANLFNWSMTYRTDSDVPIPYGRTVPLSQDAKQRISTHHITKIIPYWERKQRDVLVIALISNCYPERINYVKELQKYIKVDLIGYCAKSLRLRSSCPRNLGDSADCPKINRYLFYLSLENSRCRQYITEKVFYNAFTKGAIPIVLGAPISDYEKLLPPHSFLHVNSFFSLRDLAIEIVNLSMNADCLSMYHMWRYHFQITNEHSSFGIIPYDLCRLCQALNYNDVETKVYDVDALRLFLEPKILCTKYTKP